MTNAHTEYFLRKWGEYIKYNRSEYLGFPKRNTIHRIMKEGTGASQSTAPVEIDNDTEIEIVNSCVMRMAGHYRDAIYSRYVHRLSLRKAATKLKLSREKYRNNLKEAEARVSGYLDAKECA